MAYKIIGNKVYNISYLACGAGLYTRHNDKTVEVAFDFELPLHTQEKEGFKQLEENLIRIQANEAAAEIDKKLNEIELRLPAII